MSWNRHNEAFLHAYRGTAAWIRSQIGEEDSSLQAVMGAAE
jgi:hypothetical protein